jgi:hypothetical protein
MTARILGSDPMVGRLDPPLPPKLRVRLPREVVDVDPLRVRFVVSSVLSSLDASRESARMSSPGQAESMTRVSKAPLAVSRTVVEVAVADNGDPAELVRFSQTPPRVSKPDSMLPPMRLKAAGAMVLAEVPDPGREKTLNSPGLSRISAGI